MKYVPVLIACLMTMSLAQAENIAVERQAELTHLLKHDCGSCHGMTLKGGLGPALTPDVLINKPEAYLIHVISFGRKGTPMPPWQGILSQQDIQWLANSLKTGLITKGQVDE